MYHILQITLPKLSSCREQLDTKYLILDPWAFQPSASSPRWTDIESCVWHGPVNLLNKKPLASVPQYRGNKTLNRFFRHILGIEDANWNDYHQMLLKLRHASGSSEDISDKVLRLYHLFSEDAISNEDWAEIRYAQPPSRSQLISNSNFQQFLRERKLNLHAVHFQVVCTVRMPLDQSCSN